MVVVLGRRDGGWWGCVEVGWVERARGDAEAVWVVCDLAFRRRRSVGLETLAWAVWLFRSNQKSPRRQASSLGRVRATYWLIVKGAVVVAVRRGAWDQ